MKKVGILLLFLFIGISFVCAADPDSSDKINDAYQCLENQLENKTSSTLSLQEAIFSTLALGSDKKLTDTIESQKSTSSCWPESSCTIKDTSQVLLAYNRIGKSTDDIEKYLLSKNGSTQELTWYLQIDSTDHVTTSCTLTYDSNDYTIGINEDMKISGNPGTCLAISTSGYWLQIRPQCFGKTLYVSCDKDFITNLLYQKQGSQTIYVASETHSASSSGTTQEEVNSQCFKNGNSCDYEGSLWATLSLQETDHDISSFLPYLIAFADENERFFPSSILYLITTGDDQYNDVVQSQKSGGFWEAPSTKYNKFYDTALGLLALKDTTATETDNAKNYLLGIQTPQGCWNNNNIRDTAFLLYAGWQKSVSSGSSSGGNTPEASCQSQGLFCTDLFPCKDAGGTISTEYECGFSKVCCSVSVEPASCTSQGGIRCSSNEICSGESVSSLEGSCCLGVCQDKPSSVTQCAEQGGFCVSSCQEGETESSLDCGSSASICCIPSTESSSGWGIWITILVILIIIAVVAIIFRHKIQLWLFQLRNKKSSTGSAAPSSPRPPSYPPTSPFGRPSSPRPIPRASPRRPTSQADQEMEETLRKLREMSK